MVGIIMVLNERKTFMKIYLDSANLEAIAKYKGLVDGITTNPLIMAKEGKKQEEHLPKICSLVPTLPVSAEVVYAISTEQICDEARILAGLASNIIVKIPGNMAGLMAIRILKSEMKLNITGLMTFKQLAFASLLGADYVSQFFCRAKDAGIDSVREINLGKLKAKIIVGSLRTPKDVEEALLTNADILTINPDLLEKSFTHLKTQASIDEFTKAYEA